MGHTCTGVGDVSADVAADLQPNAHVKVLAHVRLAPKLHPSIGRVHKRALLDRGPPQKRVVAD